MWNFKIPCKYIEPLVKSVMATTVLNTGNVGGCVGI